MRALLRHYARGDFSEQCKQRRRELLSIVRDASSFHDLGKLDDGFQETLQKNRTSPRHVQHDDAGAVFLSLQGAMEAAGLVAAHHRGLARYEFVRAQPGLSNRRERRLGAHPFRTENAATRKATDERLETYWRRHEESAGLASTGDQDGRSRCGGLVRRLLLSTMVDADHTNTAAHYEPVSPMLTPLPRWGERLAALDAYVARLAKGDQSMDGVAMERQRLRDDLYAECRSASIQERMVACNASVGAGKTTAVMAHLLRIADERGFRHIFVVLPYTNIISQSVKVYREALRLPGESIEDMEAVVAEHHHQAVFDDVNLRGLATLWRAPVIVTTAVQFFETLGANKPAKLRKLHELPGSAVFIDEAHAALPADMWPVCWKWLHEWVHDWNGHAVLASGSLAEFWSLDEFRSLLEGKEPGQACSTEPPRVAPLPAGFANRFKETEHARIRFESIKPALAADDLSKLIEDVQGPRLVIVNTVQSAAVLAKYMKTDRQKQEVLHLSTALAPKDRKKIIEKIKTKLSSREENNWTLVATSLVEAGMDFSFATGFRQRCSAASLIQTGGRINRNAEVTGCGMLYDFDFADTQTFPDNPSLRNSKQALNDVFDLGWFASAQPSNLPQICQFALQKEFMVKQQNQAWMTMRNETDMDYPVVAEMCRVIRNDTELVVIDRQLAERIRLGIRVGHGELIQSSVQMHASKVGKFLLESLLTGSKELFVLPEGWKYDAECFGYMAGWFDLESAKIPGGYWFDGA
jgi:CRISPR-associated endonuclease Cas3-HD